MKWQGRRKSTNVKDARRSQSAGGSAGGLAGILNLVLRTFGIKGVLVLLVLGFAGWQLGLVDPALLLGEGEQVREVNYQPTPEEEQRYRFVEVVLADTEDVWQQAFQQMGQQYREPALVIFRGRYPTGCGMGDARMGPFYCPRDQSIYIDLSFYDELARQFDAPGDFAQAYVIAHEVGHHVQNLLGLTEKVAARRGQPDYNQYSVRLELQADYLAGVWAKQNQQYLDAGDIDEAMLAANRIGDDAIQQRTQGQVVPHAFTHGTSEQRMRWFNRGFQNGTLEGGDTFQPAYAEL